MNWPAIMAALKQAGVDLFVLEHDNPNNFDRFARRSMQTMRSLGE
jgi:sugar phosphate isomerase/epimerase